VFNFSRRTVYVKHLNKNAKTAAKRFSCFILVSFQWYINFAATVRVADEHESE